MRIIVNRPDAAPPKELRGVFDPGSASDQVPPPSDAAQPPELRDAAVEALTALREMAKEEKVSARLMLGIDASIMLYTALADSAHPEDVPEGPWGVEHIARALQEFYGGKQPFVGAVMTKHLAAADYVLNRLKGDENG